MFEKIFCSFFVCLIVFCEENVSENVSSWMWPAMCGWRVIYFQEWMFVVDVLLTQ